ncbi:alpha-1,2-fucosyltransferase [Labilibacter sediminis]|nr:alpha-1,2-fucosyltransferase [Labilibacter sediminis]
MLIVKISGGLGNQMFQYACGYALALSKNKILKLDLNLFQQNLSESERFTPRNYGLNAFSNIINSKANKQDLACFIGQSNGIFQRLKNFLYRKYYRPLTLKSSQEYIKDCNKSNFIYLDGYWQSENYFIKYRKEILAQFSFPKPTKQLELLVEEIRSNTSVSIHIRRGDYASKSAINKKYGVLELGYYIKAINYLKSIVPSFKLFVFSDDHQWVREHFNIADRFKLIDINNTLGYEDMFLMSQCNHNIIANSSYSWWSAWLNTSPSKIVIAPLKWFAIEEKNKQTEDLIPHTWIRL